MNQETCECGNTKWFIYCLTDHEVIDGEQIVETKEHRVFAVCSGCGRYNTVEDLFSHEG